MPILCLTKAMTLKRFIEIFMRTMISSPLSFARKWSIQNGLPNRVSQYAPMATLYTKKSSIIKDQRRRTKYCCEKICIKHPKDQKDLFDCPFIDSKTAHGMVKYTHFKDVIENLDRHYRIRLSTNILNLIGLLSNANMVSLRKTDIAWNIQILITELNMYSSTP